MGRSVDYLSNATKVLYIKYETEYENEDGEMVDDEFAFDDLHDNIISVIKELYPSFKDVDGRYDGRETRIILENRIVEIGISEYCGLVSISARPNQHADEYGKHGLAESFINKIWDKLQKELNKYADVLNRVGGFSDGTSVYSKL
jgi:hypothetical protein